MPLSDIPIRPAGLPTTPPPTALPLALYVHIPWCVRKCPYCDFNSHAAPDGLPETAYIDALFADLEASLPLVWGRKVGSVFIGGGTPSLFSAAGIDHLLGGIRARLPLQADAEITLEANPGTAEREKFMGFRDAGVTRLSVGIQSFNHRHLQTLGRIHSSEEARAACHMARELFPSFNLDLMYALPGQTLSESLSDVETALSFDPKHLSCYQLTLEPNTPFYATPPDLPDGDLAADMQDAIEQRLSSAGFEHYETSAFACPGHRCRHNLNYWTFGDYLGIGAGAHGKISSHDCIVRTTKPRSPKDYLASGGAVTGFSRDGDVVTAEQLPFEFMMNALRLLDGVTTPLLAERTRLSSSALRALDPIIEQARRDGLLIADPTRLAPSDTGRRFLNRLLGRFLVD